MESGTIALHMSNVETIPGKTIQQSLGLVTGSTVRAKHIGKDIFAGLKNIVGGELKAYTELLNESRNEALQRMMIAAHGMGANGIVNIRFATSSVAAGSIGIVLLRYGCRCRVRWREQHGEPDVFGLSCSPFCPLPSSCFRGPSGNGTKGA